VDFINLANHVYFGKQKYHFMLGQNTTEYNTPSNSGKDNQGIFAEGEAKYS
jgi:hypothetical protein